MNPYEIKVAHSKLVKSWQQSWVACLKFVQVCVRSFGHSACPIRKSLRSPNPFAQKRCKSSWTAQRLCSQSCIPNIEIEHDIDQVHALTIQGKSQKLYLELYFDLFDVFVRYSWPPRTLDRFQGLIQVWCQGVRPMLDY